MFVQEFILPLELQSSELIFALTRKGKYINAFYESKGNAFYEFTSITGPAAPDSHTPS